MGPRTYLELKVSGFSCSVFNWNASVYPAEFANMLIGLVSLHVYVSTIRDISVRRALRVLDVAVGLNKPHDDRLPVATPRYDDANAVISYFLVIGFGVGGVPTKWAQVEFTNTTFAPESIYLRLCTPGGGGQAQLVSEEITEPIVVLYLKNFNVPNVYGGGRKRMFNKAVLTKQTCLQQSIILHKLRDEDYKLYRRLNKADSATPGTFAFETLNRLADTLSIDAKIPVHTVCGPEEARRICTHLKEVDPLRRHVSIFCFSDTPTFHILWRTTNDCDVLSSDSTIFYDVLLSKGHFTPLTHVHSFLGGRYYCRLCCTSHSNKRAHRCRGTFVPKNYKKCGLCGSTDTDHFNDWRAIGFADTDSVECSYCGRTYPNSVCYERHLIAKKDNRHTLCQARWKCTSCHRTFSTPHKPGYTSKFHQDKGSHVCHTVFCNGCGCWVSKDHTCFLQKVTTEREKPLTVYYYDFETVVADLKHVAVLCVVIAADDEANTPYIFDDMKKLSDWMVAHPGTYVAHNSQAFDAHLLLQHFVSISPPLCFKFNACRGNKLLEVRISSNGRRSKKDRVDLRLIDSLAFLPFALARFSKTFNLPVVKGYFPYSKATEVGPTLDYTGPIPDKSFFDVDESRKQDFDAWYEEFGDGVYSLKDEMTKYCVADVQLLKLGCESFRNSFRDVTNCDPFTRCTIASICNVVFKSQYLVENSLEIFAVATDKELRPHFVGGRVEVFRLHHKCAPGERIEYVDFCSLYPWVNKYCHYPTGAHKLYDFGDRGVSYTSCMHLFTSGAAIAIVDVSCPQDLWLPLLHSKVKSLTGETKLFFDNRDKSKAGYTSMEIMKAINLGYIITRVYKVWHWKTTARGFGGSADYMDAFLKLKQESSGWPEDAKTEDERSAYINEYKLHEGILLNEAKINKNPGLRLVAKLCLNSLWGRQGMKPNECFQEKHLIHDTPESQLKLIKIARRVTNYHILGEGCALFLADGSKQSNEELSLGRSIVSAIFTTAHARLKLYGEMEKVGDALCYCDTDSLIFIARPGHYLPKLGKFLGDLTNELGEDSYSYGSTFGVEFVATASKSYSIRLNTSSSPITKVKGHSLKSTLAKRVLNFDVLKQVVYNPEHSVQVPYRNVITRDGKFGLAHCDATSKRFGWTFDKRKVSVDGSSNGTGVYTTPFNNSDDDKAGNADVADTKEGQTIFVFQSTENGSVATSLFPMVEGSAFDHVLTLFDAVFQELPNFGSVSEALSFAQERSIIYTNH